jgi:hypothetical protein
VPLTPFLETVGKIGGVDPLQTGAIWSNVGTVLVITVMSIVATVAQSPADGVNMYVVSPGMAVLMTDGFQVPLMPLVLVVDNRLAVEPIQTGVVTLNTGIVGAFTVTVVEQVVSLLQPSTTFHAIVETPVLNDPLASVPVPDLDVAPEMV